MGTSHLLLRRQDGTSVLKLCNSPMVWDYIHFALGGETRIRNEKSEWLIERVSGWWRGAETQVRGKKKKKKNTEGCEIDRFELQHKPNFNQKLWSLLFPKPSLKLVSIMTFLNTYTSFLPETITKTHFCSTRVKIIHFLWNHDTFWAAARLWESLISISCSPWSLID